MDCKTFQQRLEERIGDALSAAERRGSERHLASCPACRKLDALVRGELEIFPVEPPADLAAAILERTTGSACTRARELLCDHVDASLTAFESKLVRQHTAGCPGCRRIELALVRLSADLPSMAHVAPDAAFAGEVLAATMPRGRRGTPKRAAWADAWKRILERPRFGLEASYVGAVAMWALFGLSASPLHDVPQQALWALQQGPTAGVEKTTTAVADLRSQIGEVGRRTWQVSTRRSAEAVGQWTTELNHRLESTADARSTLRRHGSELGDAALQLDFEQTARAARGLGEGLGSLWRELTDPGASRPRKDNADKPPRKTSSDRC